MRAKSINVLPIVILSTGFLIVAFPLISFDMGNTLKLLYILCAPLLYLLTVVSLSALVSLPFQRGIVSGLFPRNLENNVYLARRVYGVCLNTIMNFSLIYGLILQVSYLKKLFFYFFGYRGHMNFTAYQDTWVRDLKLLTFGDGAYLGNQSTLGTNICTTDGKILVGRIKVLDNSQIGRLCVMGAGARIGSHCETAVRTMIGIRTRLQNNVKIAGNTAISHAVSLAEGVEIGENCYLGPKCEIGESVKIPPLSYLESGTIINNQEEADNFDTMSISHMKNHLNLLTAKV